VSAPTCGIDEQRPPINPGGASDGAPCITDLNCAGGACIREVDGHPDGYCVTVNCRDDDECNGGICLLTEAGRNCKAACTDDGDCRDGYACGTAADGRAYCTVRVSEEGGERPTEVGEISVDCQAGQSVTFTVPAGSVGFHVGPFVQQQASVRPTRLVGDNGVDLDLVLDYDFYSLNTEFLGVIAPVQFPGSDLPSLEGDREDWGGTYTLDVETTATETCFYVIPSPQPGERIDVNLYLVGVSGVTAATADSDADIASMLGAVDVIFSNADVEVGTVRFKSLSDQNTQEFSVLRDFRAILELVALSEVPGEGSNDELLSINVFLIRDFNIPDLPGLLGVSPGLPGVSGFHGNIGTGLVFSTVDLRGNPVSLGQVMTHEIGHFLGLRHTTEHGGGGDPIGDTEECSDPEQGTRCPDHRNFMFPFSIGFVDQSGLTAGQARVLQRSALIK
jgi:hypothetical protein